MTEAEFIAYIQRLVANGQISEAEAEAMIADWLSGDIQPEPATVAARGGLRDEEIAAILLLLLGLITRPLGGALPSSPPRADSLILLETFRNEVRRLATGYTAGGITLQEWTSAMEAAIQEHVTGQSLLGTGGRLSAERLRFVDELMQEQRAFLQRFADEINLRNGAGTPLSEAYIANRADAYGGVGIEQFGREWELAQRDTRYLVYQYIARDDRGTCSPCLGNHRKYFLPGRGVFPGQVCLGRSSCRCYRQPVISKKIWEELTT